MDNPGTQATKWEARHSSQTNKQKEHGPHKYPEVNPGARES
jgi:hypothetical protein